MIFYFSATGNSRHVAQKIADSIGDKAISITDCLKNNKFSFSAKENEKIGFVCPVYNVGLPITVIDFLKNLKLEAENCYVFTVITFGSFSGGASRMLKDELKEIGICTNAHFSVRMPDTWTPVYDVSDKARINKINGKADKIINEIILKINKKVKGNYDFRRLPFCEAFYKDYENMRKTSSLSVTESCIGCGKCAELCPVDAIEIRGARPVWVKEKCAMCLGCLHHCPEFAIQRGEKTVHHGQYVHK